MEGMCVYVSVVSSQRAARFVAGLLIRLNTERVRTFNLMLSVFVTVLKAIRLCFKTLKNIFPWYPEDDPTDFCDPMTF